MLTPKCWCSWGTRVSPSPLEGSKVTTTSQKHKSTHFPVHKDGEPDHSLPSSFSHGHDFNPSFSHGHGFNPKGLLQLGERGQPLATGGVQSDHYLIEELKHVYALRTELGDPDFVNNTALDSAIASADLLPPLQAWSRYVTCFQRP